MLILFRQFTDNGVLKLGSIQTLVNAKDVSSLLVT